MGKLQMQTPDPVNANVERMPNHATSGAHSTALTEPEFNQAGQRLQTLRGHGHAITARYFHFI
ncbi:MAG: hypothetical protein ACREPS_08810, partial [Rhodanobacteraceae bacterium]